MIISRTPVRVSFLGGGTDYPEAVNKWGGTVIGTTINKYSYITCRHLPAFFDYKTRLMYSKIETVKSNNDIEHRVINKVIKHLGLNNYGLEISHMADLPSSSGIGSSSTFIVGLAHALRRLSGEKYCCPLSLYHTGIFVEQFELKDIVGYQDSAWAAFGGMNIFRWKNNEPTIEKIYLQADFLDYLNRSLMLFHTGIFRDASSIASNYVPTIQDREEEHKELLELTERGIEALKSYNFQKLGNLIHKSWEIKQRYSDKITNPKINRMFCTAMQMGAYGGKLIGAGGGGCLLMMVDPARRDDILQIMANQGAVYIDFKFEPEGSKIILEDK